MPTMKHTHQAAYTLMEVIKEMQESDEYLGACYCDEPPYAPEEGEMGQIECPRCVFHRWVEDLNDAAKKLIKS